MSETATLQRPVAVPTSEVHDVEIGAAEHTTRASLYTIRYRGEVIVEAARDPEFEACRVLHARGITGRLRTWWRGSPHHALTMDIAWGATRRTGEGKAGLQTVKWQPFDREAIG